MQEFNDLRKSLQEELLPDGAAEEAAVFDLTCLHWKKRRLNIGSQLAFHQHPDIGALTDAGRNGWEGIAQHFASALQQGESVRDSIRSMTKSYRAAVESVFAAFTKQMERMTAPDATNQESEQSVAGERENFSKLTKEMAIAAAPIAPALCMLEKFNLDEKLCERAYRPELMERELKIHADIDKRIEKTLTRLAWLKDYKKLYGPKEVKALPA